MTSEQQPNVTDATIFGLLGYIVLTGVIGEYLLNLKLEKKDLFFSGLLFTWSFHHSTHSAKHHRRRRLHNGIKYTNLSFTSNMFQKS